MPERENRLGTDLHLDGAPSGVVEEVWARALGLDAVDTDMGFFDLGADSVMLVGVLKVLRRRWPRLRVADLFAHPTAGQLAAFLERLGDG